MEKTLTWRELHTLNYEGMHKYLEILESIREGTAPLYALSDFEEESSIHHDDIGIFILYQSFTDTYYDFYSFKNMEVLRERLDGSLSLTSATIVSFEELKKYIATGAIPDCPKETNGCFVHAFSYNGINKFGGPLVTYKGRMGQMPKED